MSAPRSSGLWHLSLPQGGRLIAARNWGEVRDRKTPKTDAIFRSYERITPTNFGPKSPLFFDPKNRKRFLATAKRGSAMKKGGAEVAAGPK
jgi:hypothetical protein